MSEPVRGAIDHSTGAALPTRRVGGSEVRVSSLGYGAAPIGNLYEKVDAAAAVASVEAACDAGVRYFDTAPYYGYGLSETRLGQGLKRLPREAIAISTKVGRRVYRDDHAVGGDDGFAVDGWRAEFDYSRTGVLRSFESSLQRLDTGYVDILLLHDIGRLTHGERHPQMLRQALDQALPAMAELKASGACRAIGIGVNEQEVILELLPRFDLDCVMLAGRYTVLEQHGAIRALAEAERRGVSVLAAGPYSSGLTSNARAPGRHYNYSQVDPDTLARAERLYAICAEFDVEVGAAALQFPLAHPAVATVVAGLRDRAQVDAAIARSRSAIPKAVWQRLREAGLLDDSVPTP
ncbi:aldo/keto reductase [Lysobacter sp. CA199]|uniref:aldo/keto reductase n=1 Tax=Lysobacter sp. CA199 TaxID=3455608 RepID=UPI003F8D2398